MFIVTKRFPAWRIPLMACVVLVALVGGCQSASSGTAHSTSTAIATSTTVATAPFPAFHDWRAVYLAPDNHFHAVTLDGKTDVIGPTFPGFYDGYGTALYSAGASPDGRYIAFINGATLLVFDLHAEIAPAAIIHSGTKYLPTQMNWSPDSQHVAVGLDEYVGNSTHVVSITPISIPEPPPVPGTNAPPDGPYIYPDGWIDAHTLLMHRFQVQSTNPLTDLGILEAVDSTTGATRVITTWPHAEQSLPQFAISSDGQEVFYYNFIAHLQPYTPVAEVIDTATGVVHQETALLALEEHLQTPVGGAAWQPGTHNLALELATDYLFNTDTSAAIPIKSTDTVAGWSPDGSTLVLSNATNGENTEGLGPFTLTAVTFSSGQEQLTTLTKNSMDFVFLGFIRSA